MSNQFEEDLENEFEIVSMEDENGNEIVNDTTYVNY